MERSTNSSLNNLIPILSHDINVFSIINDVSIVLFFLAPSHLFASKQNVVPEKNILS